MSSEQIRKLTQRLKGEKRKFNWDKHHVEEGLHVTQNPKNFRHFMVKLLGPPDSPYEGGWFDIELFLPNEYPMVPPKVHFNT